MDFRDTPEEAAFRRQVREFIEQNLPSDMRARDEVVLGYGLGEDPREMEWLKKLSTRGWVAPSWPEEYGGAGMSPIEQHIFREEIARARAPQPNFIGIGLAGPTIIVHGTEEQKREHLPPILSGETYWCQGFSEPEAGSDLASLRARAVRDGDDFIINGQKMWTSSAQIADRILLLARTDPDAPKHRGISYFMVDMHSPGVEARPLTNMAEIPSFNEVFLDNVRVPKKDLLGELNRGWYVATTTLDFERSGLIDPVSQEVLLEELIAWVRSKKDGSLPTLLRHELAERAIECEVAIMLSRRVASLQARGLIPNQEASVVKLYCSELSQRIAGTALKLGGMFGQIGPGSKWAALEGRLERMYRGAPGATLAGGSSEIQRVIIATRGLGLPRE